MHMAERHIDETFESSFPDPLDWPLDEAVSPDDDWGARLRDHDEIALRLAEIVAPNITEAEFLDGSQSVGLFREVQITEASDGYGFVVPPQFLDTVQYGKWRLDVSGRVEWPKQITDFGDLRFTAQGEAGWIPHLFPFEDTDERGLPVIIDRERAKVNISLASLNLGHGGNEHSVRLETESGVFVGRPYREDMMAQAYYDVVHLDEFTAEGKELYAERVLFGDDVVDLDFDLAERNEWRGNRFGSIWIPMALLRAGYNPSVTFPLFANGTENEVKQ